MRFGFVARFTLGLAILALGVIIIRTILAPPSQPVMDDNIVSKQALPISSDLPDFAAIADVKTKKITFFAFIKPGIVAANAAIMADREFLLTLQRSDLSNISEQQLVRLNAIASYYRMAVSSVTVPMIDTLLLRVDIIPAELVMVQAANESGWGTSRFARLGLNFFGQWCFSKGCGLVPSSRNQDASHEVKVFESVEHSISSYLRNLNTHAAYSKLRQIRANIRTNELELQAQDLVIGLRSYSEREDDYVAELLQMLRHNKAYL